MPRYDIRSYFVTYSANGFIPRIGLMDAQDRYVGQLEFQADGSVLEADVLQPSGFRLRYHLANYPHLIDLLRNERPLEVFFNGSGGGFENGLRTGREGVGELDR